ncbi:ribosomal protein S5/Elongation factor G/III/Vfamily protein [Striga asiatica]|uniref:Ribosomal protein S5/Elongation factor G/III/Vfamily protein n=1 Tax=Striga asiatica TaxID=4170 RepID=A0A5A7P0W8_STRAF|nr:ribosomal protein S5/Elongation factor G/III/Vfamily protein [Striga asiatica]
MQSPLHLTTNSNPTSATTKVFNDLPLDNPSIGNFKFVLPVYLWIFILLHIANGIGAGYNCDVAWLWLSGQGLVNSFILFEKMRTRQENPGWNVLGFEHEDDLRLLVSGGQGMNLCRLLSRNAR